jgi:group I intron endonuclease
MSSKNIYTIYKSTNIINGKVYIGFDSNFPNRKNVHKSASKKQNYKFYRAIRKHGWDNFVWEIIYQSKDKEHTLKIMEPYFINEYNSFYAGYNSTFGGDGTFGLILSDSAKKLISEKNKIPKPQTEQHTRNIALGLRKYYDCNPGKPCSEETKLKISLALTGVPRPFTDEHKLNLKCHENNTTTIECQYCGKHGQLTNMKSRHIPYCDLNPNKLDKPIKIITCPYCNYSANDSPNFRRYHNNNCKLSPHRH